MGQETRPTDEQLLKRFVEGADQAAFAEIVRRHGGMVMGLCLRMLRNAQDAEDAFQATFCILSGKAGRFRAEAGSLGNWLYGIAVHVARGARSDMIRRRTHESRAAAQEARVLKPDTSWREVGPVLDEELCRLPDKYRAPLVLCYLEGKTAERAAQELGRPAGSMSRLLAEGRERLRVRLAGRGVAVTGVVLAALMASDAGAVTLPSAVVAATVKAAGGGVVSGSIQALVKGGLKTMLMVKMKIAAAALAAGLTCSGGGLLAYRIVAGEPPTQEKKLTTAVPSKKTKGDLTPESFAALHKLIRPVPGVESKWITSGIQWMNNPSLARKKAAEEGKPLFFMWGSQGPATFLAGC